MTLTQDQEIDIFVASKIGSFKHIKYHTDPTRNSKKCIENLVEIKSLQKDDTITCMVWSSAEQNEILIAKQNQQIQTYNTLDGFQKTYTADFGTGHVVGLGRCKRKMIAALSGGVVKIWSKKHEDTMDVGKLERMRVCDDDYTMFATGGEENDLKVWKIGESSPTFVAKNLAHDWLQLRRPVWVSDLTFLPGEAGRLLVACSRHGYVSQVLVGFGRGQLHQVDLRQSRLDKGFKGCAGAVTAALALREAGLVVSASLDRQLRVHRYRTKELVYRQYLTSKLTHLLVQTAGSTPLRGAAAEPEVKEEAEEAEPDEMDALFDNMETVGR